jgi:hypothetical protein
MLKAIEKEDYRIKIPFPYANIKDGGFKTTVVGETIKLNPKEGYFLSKMGRVEKIPVIKSEEIKVEEVEVTNIENSVEISDEKPIKKAKNIKKNKENDA